MIHNWVCEDNLRPFLTVLAWIVEYDFDLDDWTAISHGVRGTNDKAHQWYEYEFAGTQSARCWLACADGATVMNVQIEVPEIFEAQIEVAFLVCQDFNISMRR
jgi:hypothetical protein